MATTGKDRAMMGMGRADTPPLFDSWLQARLQRLYDETLAEPLPADLLDLLSGDGID